MATPKIITEGLASIKTAGKVFYNPVQEFNRDISISVLKTYAETLRPTKPPLEPAEENGLYILEALSATGLRSIRYAKEISGVKQIIANDLSKKAVEDIEANITENNVGDLVKASHCDATMLMYQHRQKDSQFDAIDLDPYGCPSIFLDSAVQAVKEGGLLLVTATDMAVLAGNSPETCYSKYGAVSLRIKSCHEMAIRILLQCIESHANRYGRYIEPLLSLSADFYIRVFVRVFTGPSKCKQTTSKLSHVYHCTGCDSFAFQPLGVLKTNDKNNQIKFGIPTGPAVEKNCQHCLHPHHIGGPIWSAPIHSSDFVKDVLANAPTNLGTYKRIQGVLSVIAEELLDCPLYYTLERLSGTVHVETPPMMSVRSAILNAGYKVSFTHMNKTSIKTNAPAKVIWDIMRCWELQHPASKKRLLDNSSAKNILEQKPEKEYSFEMHPQANPDSRRMGFVRFQENPLPHWGPGTKATAMIGDEKMTKSKRNQGKKRKCEESLEDNK